MEIGRFENCPRILRHIRVGTGLSESSLEICRPEQAQRSPCTCLAIAGTALRLVRPTPKSSIDVAIPRLILLTDSLTQIRCCFIQCLRPVARNL